MRSKPKAKGSKPLLDSDLCKVMREDFKKYLTQTYIQPEQGEGMRPLKPSSTQREVLEELDSSPINEGGSWVIVNKPRQAQTSTLCVAWLLREIEYGFGKNGLLICDKDSTNAELFERMRLMHGRQPPEVQVPAKRNAAKELSFPAGGRLKVATARGKNPAIGFSIDRLVCSELGFWPDAEKVCSQLFPTVLKRKEARVVIESTPSLHGHFYQKLWYAALEGGGRFKPKFIRWWEHDSYKKLCPPGWAPDGTMEGILAKHSGMTWEHAFFMQEALDSIFSGDLQLFLHSYPMNVRDGWLSSESPALPKESLMEMEENAVADNATLGKGFTFNDVPEHGHSYLLAADPAGYGKSGDPSALTVIDLNTRTEVSAWCGRMDPSQFGIACVEAARYWNNAMLAIEANAAAAATSALHAGYHNIYSAPGSSQPGYYSTKQNKESSTEALASALHKRSVRIRSKAGIAQMLAYDGTDKRSSIDGERTHWDRVVSYRIALDIMRGMRLPTLEVPPPEVYVPRPLTYNDYKALSAQTRRR